MVWIKLTLCIVAIVFAGTKLSRLADEIADKTGLSGSWVGLILLATVTSLPELISGVSAVTLNDLPNIAVGGVLGSCLFNLVIISILDVAAGAAPLSNRVHHSHVISAGYGIVLLASVVFSKLVGLNIGNVDPFSVLFLVVYGLGMRTVFQFESRKKLEAAAETTQKALARGELIRPLSMFLLFSIVIVAAALYLPEVADEVGKITGLSSTFIGSSLVAITTSLPEVVVSLAAAKMGAFDMALGNVLGSNLFNVAILGIEDLCYRPAPLLAAASADHMFSAIGTIICTAIAAIGITFRAERKVFPMAWDSASIMLCYLVISYLLFARG